MQPGRDLTGPALSRARGAGFNVSPSFTSRLQTLSTEVLQTALRDHATDPETATLQGIDEVMTEVIVVAQSRHDNRLEAEHVRLALASICPLWPIC